MINTHKSQRKYKHWICFEIILICLNNQPECNNTIKFTNHIPLVKLITRLILMNIVLSLSFLYT